jgi:transcriptional regulator with XRE-family HTH domain
MVSKKDLLSLIKEIKEKTGKTQEEISAGAGYEPKTLSQLMSKGANLEGAYTQLKLVYGQKLNNSTSARGKADPINLEAIGQALARIEIGQQYIRSEIRGYGQYYIMEQVKWDQKKFLKAMEQVGKLVGANLQADDGQGTE